MTVEKAIEILKEDKGLYGSEICYAGDGTPEGDLLQALDMAIEALKKVQDYETQYRVLEEVNEELPIPYDVEIDGKQYYEGCDYDRMVLDAADMLEGMI